MNIDLTTSLINTIYTHQSQDLNSVQDIAHELSRIYPEAVEYFLKPLARLLLADELKQKEQEQEEVTYAIGDYFKTSSTDCIYRIIVEDTLDGGDVAYLQKIHRDYYRWRTDKDNHINDRTKITAKEFANILGEVGDKFFTKITKSEAEKIVGHSLD